MQLTCKIRLRSELLGDRRTTEGIRRFNKDGHGNWLIPIPQWRWAFTEAINDLNLKDTSVDFYRFESSIRMPKVVLFERSWSQENKKMQQREMFESIRKNTQITFKMLVTSAVEPGTHCRLDVRPPHRDETETILKYIGEFLGLSPWGSKFGFGRFSLINLEDATRTIITNDKTSAPPNTPGVG